MATYGKTKGITQQPGKWCDISSTGNKPCVTYLETFHCKILLKG